MRAALRLAAGAVFAVGACAVFDTDIPSRSCTRDGDCFVAQGESCHLATGQCGPRPDAGPPDADPPDADPPDAGDADLPDADLPDAGAEVLDAVVPDAASADVDDAAAGAP